MSPDPRQIGRGHHSAPSRDQLLKVGAVFLLLIIGIIPWRSDAIYSGGADGIVVAKAVIGLVALLLALRLRAKARETYPIGLAPAGVFVLVLLLSLLGALAADDVTPTLVLVIRIFLLMSTVLLLLSCLPWTHAVGALLTAMAIVAVLAAVTGLGTMVDGRLSGGVPDIHPNELAALASAPFVGVLVLALRTRLEAWHLLAAAILFGIVAASGSRSALLGVLVAVVIALLTNGRLERRASAMLIGSLPIAYVIVFFTGVLQELASRGGTSELATSLDSRWDAWRSVFAWHWGSWEKWIGLGLATKEVKVDVKWLDTQVLDSSWVSLLAQAGVLGAALVVMVVFWSVAKAVLSSDRRGVLLPILALVVIGSFTESGLVDSSLQMILFLTVATLLTRRSQGGKVNRQIRQTSTPFPALS